ncbi:G2 M phase-specific E3 ubiquitin- ligase-like protein [Labeo rohita]|uniref:Gypsy retrotransposon integrase-like protein 1 n=1 Tax=Labeo rohita TaxID=84645 RepID=A0A498LU79_LABRO|nr:G2 M phase-specific E3 ubiquitin- ligase-like protein [Labeo rohita]
MYLINCSLNAIDTIFSTRSLGSGEPNCPAGTFAAGYVMDGWKKWRIVCLAPLSVEDIEDIYVFGAMITGILLTGFGGALLYRKLENIMQKLAAMQWDLDLETREIPDSSTTRQKLRRVSPNFIIKDDRLFYVGPSRQYMRLVVLSEEEKRSVLTECHNNPGTGNHCGVRGTQNRVIAAYYWPTIIQDVKEWVKEPWEVLGLDLIGPLPETARNKKFILTMTDLYTKWVIAEPMQSKTAAEVSAVITTKLYMFGMVRKIITDQGKEFVCKLNDSIFSMLKIKHAVSSAYHPQTNGQDKRTNQNINRALRKYVNDNHNDLDLHLPAVVYGINTAKQVLHNIKKAQSMQQKTFQNRKRKFVRVCSVQDPKRQRTGDTFTSQHQGPYTVASISSKGVATIVKGSTCQKVNVSRLRTYYRLKICSQYLYILPINIHRVDGEVLPRRWPTLPKFCSSCGRNVSFVMENARKPLGEDQASCQAVPRVTDARAVPGKSASAVVQFMKYRQLKETERKTFSKSKKKSNKPVKISVGIMNKTKNGLRPMRGKNLPLHVDPQWSSEQLLAAALKKQKDFNQDMEDGEYVLLYPDGSQIKNIPGTDTPFTIGEYKEAIGKAYQRITLYICTLEDLLSKSQPQHLHHQHPSHLMGNVYTHIYAPITIDSSSSDLEEVEKLPEKDRFKEGFATLDFVNALEQHPSLFFSFMCYTETKLTADAVENIFHVQFSQPGSTNRQEEARVLSYWRDYLLYLEEKEATPSLEDVLMFGTGLKEVPPAAIQPQPQLVFQKSARFPMANVCTNTIKIPILPSYEDFQEAMDYGMQNSPGFGLP